MWYSFFVTKLLANMKHFAYGIDTIPKYLERLAVAGMSYKDHTRLLNIGHAITAVRSEIV